MSGTRPLRLLLEAALVGALAGAYLASLQFLTPYIPGVDGYYHIKIAWIMRTEGLLQTFPWATQSLWADAFYDKDFGFHLALMPFSFGDLATGAKWAAVTLAAVLFASFYTILRLRRMPLAWLWVVLLAASGGYFAWRLSMPRPHVLAVLLSLWSVFWVLRGSWVGSGLLGVVYALSYTAPLLPVYATLHAAACRVLGRPVPWRMVVASFGGVLLGWALHPHFPHNFVAVWIQVVDVLRSAWSDQATSLALAGEFLAADTRTFLLENLVVLVASASTIGVLANGRPRLVPERVTVTAVAGAFFVAACLSVRFVDYFVPFALWACAEWIGAEIGQPRYATPRRSRRARLALALGALGVVVLFVLGDATSRRYLSHPSPSRRRSGAEWLAKNAPPSTIVFTCDWDDAPELFFYNHANRYLVFLDPNYLYRWNPERWELWREVAEGRARDPVATIEQVFGARYGYCTNAFRDLRQQLEAHPEARVEAAGGHGYVFALR